MTGKIAVLLGLVLVSLVAASPYGRYRNSGVKGRGSATRDDPVTSTGAVGSTSTSVHLEGTSVVGESSHPDRGVNAGAVGTMLGGSTIAGSGNSGVIGGVHSVTTPLVGGTSLVSGATHGIHRDVGGGDSHAINADSASGTSIVNEATHIVSAGVVGRDSHDVSTGIVGDKGIANAVNYEGSTSVSGIAAVHGDTQSVIIDTVESTVDSSGMVNGITHGINPGTLGGTGVVSGIAHDANSGVIVGTGVISSGVSHGISTGVLGGTSVVSGAPHGTSTGVVREITHGINEDVVGGTSVVNEITHGISTITGQGSNPGRVDIRGTSYSGSTGTTGGTGVVTGSAGVGGVSNHGGLDFVKDISTGTGHGAGHLHSSDGTIIGESGVLEGGIDSGESVVGVIGVQLPGGSNVSYDENDYPDIIPGFPFQTSYPGKGHAGCVNWCRSSVQKNYYCCTRTSYKG